MTAVCELPVRGSGHPATGTFAGWMRHYRARQAPCEQCREGNRRHCREWVKNHPDYVRPDRRHD